MTRATYDRGLLWLALGCTLIGCLLLGMLT